MYRFWNTLFCRPSSLILSELGADSVRRGPRLVLFFADVMKLPLMRRRHVCSSKLSNSKKLFLPTTAGPLINRHVVLISLCLFASVCPPPSWGQACCYLLLSFIKRHLRTRVVPAGLPLTDRMRGMSRQVELAKAISTLRGFVSLHVSLVI